MSETLFLEEDILPAKAYNEALAESDVLLLMEQATTTIDPKTGHPDFDLLPNRPNPFNGNTTIGFVLPEACEVQLRVFNMDGMELWRVSKTYPLEITRKFCS
ncbi:MAG: hypothetical protein IPH04_10770 [Saprospirales bacterium]|nr:hypothetical protein [Saprospirales bacterium]